MSQLDRARVFTGITRPQMFGGVTYSYFIINGILTAELFLIFKSFWMILLAVIIHIIGVVACLKEPRIFDLWIGKLMHCPRIPNYKMWGCNSYRP